MKKCYLVCLVLTAAAVAAPFDVDLSYDALQLKNGRSLNKAVIKSYDHENGKVVILVDRSLTSIQIELLPDEIAQRIIAMVPPESKALERTDRTERKHDQHAARTDDAQAARDRTERLQREAAEARRAQDEARESQQAERFVSQSLELAKTRAYRYYRYENKPGSGYVLIVRRGIELEDPVEVPGWGKRLRISGQVDLEFYDSYGRSFNATTAKFEVITEMDDKGHVKVVDFSPK
jgi:hypothetical protein